MLQEMQRKTKMRCKPSVLTTKRNRERKYWVLFSVVSQGPLRLVVCACTTRLASVFLQEQKERLGIARALHRTWSHVLKSNAG